MIGYLLMYGLVVLFSGDEKYKPFVSEIPDIKRIDLDGSEDFLIIACDGFWERATEDIAAALLYEYVCSKHCEYSSTFLPYHFHI